MPLSRTQLGQGHQSSIASQGHQYDWRAATRYGIALGLAKHVPVAVGIVVRGLAVCVVLEVANLAFGLEAIVRFIVTLGA